MSRKNSRFIVLPALVLAVLILAPQPLRLQEEMSYGQVDLPPCPDPPLDKNPRVNSFLVQLADAFRTQGTEAARELARRRGLDAGPDALRITAKAGLPLKLGRAVADQLGTRLAVEALAADLESLGGLVESKQGSWVQASLPFASLERLFASPSFVYLTIPLRPTPADTTSEGVARTGANQWHDLPMFHGTDPVKICILDVGFEGYEDLLGDELPPEDMVTVRSFRADRDIEASESHGTACAEIVHDMAPDAHLYLVNFNSSQEETNAVAWLISQNVQVISNSIGWFNAGAGDGTGPICDDVQRASAGGILWVGSAGNYAYDHWQDVFSDTDGDGWHNFAGADELLEFEVPAFDVVGAYLNWDDWGTWMGYDYSGSDQDYDLYLYRWNGLVYQLVGSSTSPQTGFQWPTEDLDGYFSSVKTNWAVAIRKNSASRDVTLELFLGRNSSKACEYDTPAGSIAVPSDAGSHISVGATDWSDDSYHYYSSRGPTQDGRIRPVFSAPSGVSTRTYGPRNFFGTSSSAPHVAGALGLLLGNTPYSREDVLDLLKARALDLGPVGQDNQFGYGRIDLRR